MNKAFLNFQNSFAIPVCNFFIYFGLWLDPLKKSSMFDQKWHKMNKSCAELAILKHFLLFSGIHPIRHYLP